MKTLDEHNKEKTERHNELTGVPKRNGLGCPNCSNELFDTDPSRILLSAPPKKKIHCEGCGYSGYRIA